MRVHIFATYWIGGAVGLLVGTIIGFGISMSGDTCGLRLPAVTMGGEAQFDCWSNSGGCRVTVVEVPPDHKVAPQETCWHHNIDHTMFCEASR